MARPGDPQSDKQAARRLMEGAFRSFVGEVLRIKRGVVAAPGAAACDIVQQRILDHFRAVNEQMERRLAAHDARIYDEVKYLMIAMADEAFLQFEWAGRLAWASHPLEAQEFKSHNAGERFFYELDAVLERRMIKPTELLLVYLHALSIGFRGRFAPIEPGRPEEYRKRLIDHLRRLPERITREGDVLCPEALAHPPKRSSRLKLESLSRGTLPLILAVVAWIVLGAVLFQVRTAALSDVLERIEAIR